MFFSSFKVDKVSATPTHSPGFLLCTKMTLTAFWKLILIAQVAAQQLFVVFHIFSDKMCLVFSLTQLTHRQSHRRRIELKDKAKVVASDWGTESLLRQNSTVCFKQTEAKQLARQGGGLNLTVCFKQMDQLFF